MSWTRDSRAARSPSYSWRMASGAAAMRAGRKPRALDAPGGPTPPDAAQTNVYLRNSRSSVQIRVSGPDSTNEFGPPGSPDGVPPPELTAAMTPFGLALETGVPTGPALAVAGLDLALPSAGLVELPASFDDTRRLGPDHVWCHRGHDAPLVVGPSGERTGRAGRCRCTRRASSDRRP